jgi:hypothetical protein
MYMTTVTLKTNNVHDAIQWCHQHIGFENFAIDNQFPSWNWSFKFRQPEHATHFALRWSR